MNRSCRAGIVWLLFLLVGCEDNRMRSGVVVSSEPPLLGHFREFAPRVFVQRDGAGKPVRLDKIGGPFYVVGFVEPPRRDAEYLHPVLTDLAQKFWLDSIPVIQITLPTKRCPPEEIRKEAGAEIPPETKDNFARFFDADRIAWEAFDRPRPGTILVVDRTSLVPLLDARATLADPPRLVARLEELQRQWEEDQRVRGLTKAP